MTFCQFIMFHDRFQFPEFLGFLVSVGTLGEYMATGRPQIGKLIQIFSTGTI